MVTDASRREITEMHYRRRHEPSGIMTKIPRDDGRDHDVHAEETVNKTCRRIARGSFASFSASDTMGMPGSRE